jgi:hypothetical protein
MNETLIHNDVTQGIAVAGARVTRRRGRHDCEYSDGGQAPCVYQMNPQVGCQHWLRQSRSAAYSAVNPKNAILQMHDAGRSRRGVLAPSGRFFAGIMLLRYAQRATAAIETRNRRYLWMRTLKISPASG